MKEEESKGSILRYKTHAFKFRESRYAVDFGKVPNKNLVQKTKEILVPKKNHQYR